jgi:hypothetical protein
MAWATNHIASLASGESVKFRPHGNSMSGKIESGQLVTVEPVTDLETLKVDDIVLCKVNGFQYLHIIDSIADGRFMIKNNKGHQNGWTKAIYGRLISVED